MQVQYSTVQYSDAGTVQYSTVQHSRVQFSTAQTPCNENVRFKNSLNISHTFCGRVT